MTIFYNHLHLFDTLNNVKKFNITNFEREKVFQEEDVVLYVLKNNKDEVVYRFAIADTDINALYSFHQDDRLSRFKLKYILREKEINEYLSGKEIYSIPDEYKEDIKKIYNEILSRMKEIIRDYKEIGLSKDTAISLCEEDIRIIVRIFHFYQFNKIDNFDYENSYDYINEVTLNRLEEQQKEEIKRYYVDLPSIYNYHDIALKDAVSEAVDILKEFKDM